MPATAVGALIALLIAPGFLLVRGYERRKYRVRPDRDIYAVAEAVVASAIWLGVVWVVLAKLLGDPLSHDGLIPFEQDRVRHHPVEVVSLLLAVIVVPYVVGVSLAVAGNALASTTRSGWRDLAGGARRLGFFKIPTAWDRAWAQLARAGSGSVVIKLKDGSFVVGGYGRGSRIDTSPLPTHNVYLPKAHAHASPDFRGGVAALLDLDSDETRAALLKDPHFQPITEAVGVIVDGAEITAIFFKES